MIGNDPSGNIISRRTIKFFVRFYSKCLAVYSLVDSYPINGNEDERFVVSRIGSSVVSGKSGAISISQNAYCNKLNCERSTEIKRFVWMTSECVL